MKNRLLIIGLCGQSVFMRVPHFHRPEETLHASSLFMEPGGKGYNQAVAAARMGADVVFAGAVGDDEDGNACGKRLDREGVRSVMIRKEQRTACAVILTDACGENRVTVYAGAQLTAEDICGIEDFIAQAEMLLLTPEIPETAFSEAVRLAQQYRVRLVINPAPWFEWTRQYLRCAWLLTPNRSEGCALLNCTDADLHEALRQAPYERLIVTLGSVGALCKEYDRISLIPAPQVKTVDTTGAGDCLNGTLCALLMRGFSLSDAARAAVQAASLSVRKAYVLDSFPAFEDLVMPWG